MELKNNLEMNLSNNLSNEEMSSISPFIDKLNLFKSEVLKFNQKVNLISKSTEPNVDIIHILDGLKAVLLVQGQTPVPFYSLMDIGSGNGIPGLMYAILNPQGVVYLVERDQRKAEFLKHMVFKLNLDQTQVLCGSVPDQFQDIKAEAYISRGFASIKKSLELVEGFQDMGQYYFHLKSQRVKEELIEAQYLSHWQNSLLGTYDLDDLERSRTVILSAYLR